MKITDEQIDFLTEIVNISAGNAAVAFSQIIGQPVDVKIPKVHVLLPKEVSSFFEEPSSAVSCARMDMVGDVTGGMFFVVPESMRAELVRLARESSQVRFEEDIDRSVIEEIGNIVSGVYLLAIYNFCRLNIFHTVPDMVTDMVQSAVDETISVQSMKSAKIILIENEFEFSVIHKKFTAFLLIVLSAPSIDTLVNSIEQARQAMEEM